MLHGQDFLVGIADGKRVNMKSSSTVELGGGAAAGGAWQNPARSVRAQTHDALRQERLALIL